MALKNFKVGDWVENVLAYPGITKGALYMIVEAMTGAELKLPYNPKLLYPIIVDDRGKKMAIHPDHLFLWKSRPPPKFALEGGAEEYEEIMAMQAAGAEG